MSMSMACTSRVLALLAACFYVIVPSRERMQALVLLPDSTMSWTAVMHKSLCYCVCSYDNDSSEGGFQSESTL